jgi:hypothetical protein
MAAFASDDQGVANETGRRITSRNNAYLHLGLRIKPEGVAPGPTLEVENGFNNPNPERIRNRQRPLKFGESEKRR